MHYGKFDVWGTVIGMVVAFLLLVVFQNVVQAFYNGSAMTSAPSMILIKDSRPQTILCILVLLGILGIFFRLPPMHWSDAVLIFVISILGFKELTEMLKVPWSSLSLPEIKGTNQMIPYLALSGICAGIGTVYSKWTNR